MTAVPVIEAMQLPGKAISLKEQRDDLSSMISLQIRQAWLDIQETQKRIAVTQQANVSR